MRVVGQAGSNGPTSTVEGWPCPLHGGGRVVSNPTMSITPPLWSICHSGAGRPSGHQFDQRNRTEAESPGAIVTTGQPGGGVAPAASQAAGELMNVTAPESIGVC